MEKHVWESADIDVVPLPIFVVSAKTGGQVLGAFDGERMVGFTLAFPAFRGRMRFLHSHMTAVVAEYQNRGIGRQLKLFQRQDALERGLRLVEWTFDPLELRNAYFNLVRLGAIVRRYIPDCYGTTTSPLHANLPTDRLVAEWWLASRRVRAIVAGRAAPAALRRRGSEARIFVPADIRELRYEQPDEAARIQKRVRQEFQHWLARNYAVTGIETTSEGSYYRLEPYARSLTHTV